MRCKFRFLLLLLLASVGSYRAFAQAPRGTLNGLYLQVRPMVGDASSGRVEWAYYYFLPGGRVCEKAPPGGLDPAHDFARISVSVSKENEENVV